MPVETKAANHGGRLDEHERDVQCRELPGCDGVQPEPDDEHSDEACDRDELPVRATPPVERPTHGAVPLRRFQAELALPPVLTFEAGPASTVV
eukprot:3665328-Rhodomonas_salina.2